MLINVYIINIIYHCLKTFYLIIQTIKSFDIVGELIGGLFTIIVLRITICNENKKVEEQNRINNIPLLDENMVDYYIKVGETNFLTFKVLKNKEVDLYSVSKKLIIKNYGNGNYIINKIEVFSNDKQYLLNDIKTNIKDIYANKNDEIEFDLNILIPECDKDKNFKLSLYVYYCDILFNLYKKELKIELISKKDGRYVVDIKKEKYIYLGKK